MTAPNDFASWIGREEVATDVASPTPIHGLMALLDHTSEHRALPTVPLLGHWLYFLPHARQSDIGVDGHPKRGGFLPPIPLERRMWAGGRLTFHVPIPIGAKIERQSVIANVAFKQGRSGEMAFVTVHHAIRTNGVLAIAEEQDLVYRGASGKSVADERPAQASSATREVQPDPVQLFRYSALTFNSHRIHYDSDYARDIEGYPGVVVQAPYMATLLMDHFQNVMVKSTVTRFDFRARRPLFAGTPAKLCLCPNDRQSDLWTVDAGGNVTMTASIEIA